MSQVVLRLFYRIFRKPLRLSIYFRFSWLPQGHQPSVVFTARWGPYWLIFIIRHPVKYLIQRHLRGGSRLKLLRNRRRGVSKVCLIKGENDEYSIRGCSWMDDLLEDAAEDVCPEKSEQQGMLLYSHLSELPLRRSLVDSICDCQNSKIRKHCDRGRNFTHGLMCVLNSSGLLWRSLIGSKN